MSLLIEKTENKLIQQAKDSFYTRNRRVLLGKRPDGKSVIFYTTPNGLRFEIDPQNYPYGDPIFYSPDVESYNLPQGHLYHCFGEGRACLGTNLNRYDLKTLLFILDLWAKGFDKYRHTGRFPSDWKEAQFTSIYR